MARIIKRLDEAAAVLRTQLLRLWQRSVLLSLAVVLLGAGIAIYLTIPKLTWATVGTSIADNLIAFGGGILIADVFMARIAERRQKHVVSLVIKYWLFKMDEHIAKLGGTAEAAPDGLAKQFKWREDSLRLHADILEEQMFAFAPFLDVEIVARFHELHRVALAILVNKEDAAEVSRLADHGLAVIRHIGKQLEISKFDEILQVAAENQAERDA